MASVKRITKEIEQAKADNKQQKEQYEQRIMAARACVISARQEMDIAAAADDEQAFIAASDKVRFNESVIAANEAKLASLENTQKKIVAEMIGKARAAQAEISKAAEEKAASSVYEIFVLATKAQEEIDVLQKLICEYAEEVGNTEPIRPYHYNSDLDNLLNAIKTNKSRTDRFANGSALYRNIS